MAELKGGVTIRSYIEPVARQLSARVDDSYQLAKDSTPLHPLFVDEVELESATDALSELEESAGALRALMQAILNARREQDSSMKPL